MQSIYTQEKSIPTRSLEELKKTLKTAQTELVEQNYVKYRDLPVTPNNVDAFMRNLQLMLHKFKKYQKFGVDFVYNSQYKNCTGYLFTRLSNNHHKMKGDRINCATLHFTGERLYQVELDFHNSYEDTYSLESAEKFALQLLEKYPSKPFDIE